MTSILKCPVPLRPCSLPQGAEPPRANVWGYTVTQRSYSLPRSAEPARASVLGLYRYATFVFAPARRGARAGECFGVVPLRSFRVRSREARSPRGRVFGGCTVTQRSYSLPRDLSTTLEMTRRGSVSFCFIRLFCKYGRSRLAIGGSPTGGRGTPLPRFIESKYGQVFGFSCSLGFIPIAGDFSTNARNDNVFTWFYCYFDRFCRSGRGTPPTF